MIACQIYAVNRDENPKRGFLYDCGGVGDIGSLLKVLLAMKELSLVGKDILIALVKEDIFILNAKKFQRNAVDDVIVVDVSGSLSAPRRIEVSIAFEGMFHSISEQLRVADKDKVLRMEIRDDWCVPMIFGHLIAYPILYYQNPAEDTNCIGLIDLVIHQVITKNETLISFSVPSLIYNSDKNIQETIDRFLHNFQHHDDHQIKTFTANNPTVVL